MSRAVAYNGLWMPRANSHGTHWMSVSHRLNHSCFLILIIFRVLKIGRSPPFRDPFKPLRIICLGQCPWGPHPRNPATLNPRLRHWLWVLDWWLILLIMTFFYARLVGWASEHTRYGEVLFSFRVGRFEVKVKSFPSRLEGVCGMYC